MKKNFAVIGVAGYIAGRHLEAIRDTGNNLVAVCDVNSSVGVIDAFSGCNAKYFKDVCELRDYILREKNVDYVSICTPNYLHFDHVRYMLNAGANVICEKPMVLYPIECDVLNDIARIHKVKINNMLQLRIHPEVKKFRKMVERTKLKEKINVGLMYVAARGDWYLKSWKGDESRSGGISMNIGIHLFDLMILLFGKVEITETYHVSDCVSSGYMELEKAKVEWYLSIKKDDVPVCSRYRDAYRVMKTDIGDIDLSRGMDGLQTEMYKKILAGEGYGVDEVRDSISVVYGIEKYGERKECEE